MIKKNKKVGIIGLGYVGLPFLHLLSKKNKIDAYGFDLDQNKIKLIKDNKPYISDLKNKDLKIIDKRNIFTMDQIENIKLMDFIIICLPTPLTKKKSPDISIIKSAFNLIKKYLKNNQTIILESTVYPGATKDIFHEYLNKKFNIGKNFFYGYSSERVSPGQTNKKEYKFSLYNTTKVVSGNDNLSLSKIKKLYKGIFKSIHIADSIEVAEMSKLVENSYRSVNIGLINEIKKICYSLNLNFNNVLDTAATKPFGFNVFRPGPGVGGHCIPIDPAFVTWIAKKNKQKAKFIELAGKINLNITKWILDKICKLNKSIKSKNKKIKILIVGLAYKADVNDLRESPSIKIFNYLKKYNNDVEYYDPFVKKTKINNKEYKSIDINLNLTRKFELTIICTAHSNLNKKKIFEISKKIYDTRGMYKKNKSKKIFQL